MKEDKTDDLIIFFRIYTKTKHKLLAQVKNELFFTENNYILKDVPNSTIF